MYPKLLIAISFILSSFTLAATEKILPSKPNIIIILSDDHGYTDLGIQGIDGNVKTPALDRLASQGALMKNTDAIIGKTTVAKWDGSENSPLRDEKGFLWEGGMRVPVSAYWKGHIPADQVIKESIITLDFTATTLQLAGGTNPPEFDGINVLPFLTKKKIGLTRVNDLLWDWGDGIALQQGDWKIHRYGKKLAFFNIKQDPNEFFDVHQQQPEHFKSMETTLMARCNSLPENGISRLKGKENTLHIKGAPTGTPLDPRFNCPY